MKFVKNLTYNNLYYIFDTTCVLLMMSAMAQIKNIMLLATFEELRKTAL